MKKNTTVFSVFIFLFCIAACNDAELQAKKVENKNNSNTPKDTIIDFYLIDQLYIQYLPDTSLQFNTRSDLKSYFFSKSKSKKKFEDSLFSKNSINDYWILNKRTSGILFDERMEYIYFKTYQHQKKDISTIGLLSFCSPYSNLVDIADRISFYNSFPDGMKQSEIGKKTFATLKEYQFKENLEKTSFLTSKTALRLADKSNLQLAEIFKNSVPYYLIVFGASWCSPCRLDEKQLKYWSKYLDSTRIQIIGLSVDESIEKWDNYIKEEKFPWKNYIIDKGMASPLIKELSFESIPRNFLVDKNGVILSENTDIRQVLKVYLSLDSFRKL